MSSKRNKIYTLCTAAIGAIYIAGYGISDPAMAGVLLSKNQPSIQSTVPSTSDIQTVLSDNIQTTPSDSPASQSSSTENTLTSTGNTTKKSGTLNMASSKTVTHPKKQVVTKSTTASTKSTTTKSSTTKPSTKPSITKPVVKKQKYKDGVYKGQGSNWNGTVGVTLAIKKGKITSVQITTCTTSYPEWVMQSLPPEVVSRQSDQVDIVSGATVSTFDFKVAVQRALKKALNT